MTKNILFVFLCLFISANGYARPRRIQSFTSLDLGGYGTNLIERFNVNPENASLVSTLGGYARIRRGIKLGQSLLFEPSFGTMLPWRAGADGKTYTFMSHLDLTVGWHLLSWLKVRIGSGVQWTLIMGNGATVTLPNGNGTSDFYNPSGASNAFLMTANGGLEFVLSEKVSVALDAYILQVASESRRSLNASATLGIRL